MYFAGDAAHIHSPMGARGMNLGLEDAFVFAQLAGQGGSRNTTRCVTRSMPASCIRSSFSRGCLSEDAWYFDLIRRYVFPTLAKTPFQARIKQTVSGLDHELPADLAVPPNAVRSSVRADGRSGYTVRPAIREFSVWRS